MKKPCKKCGLDVRFADYYRAPRTSDGFMSVCKACHRQNVKANRIANADHYREFDRQRAMLPHRVEARAAYAQTPEGRAAFIRAGKRYAQRNPLKRAAQIASGNAIRDGKLVRQPCEVCGAEKTQGHHDDYSKPLDVRWLCTTHHAEWHKHNTPKCPDQTQVVAQAKKA